MFNLILEGKDFEKSLVVLLLSVAILLSICGCERCGSPAPPILSPPGRDRTIFAGTNDGFCKSPYGGEGWFLINRGLTNLHVSSLVISPTYATDRTVFAGTGYPGEIFKSEGGSWESWRKCWGIDIDRGEVYVLAISPNYANDSTIFAGTWGEGGGVFKSEDGGESWRVVGLPGDTVYALAISPNYATDSTIFAGTSPYGRAGGAYKSEDGGESWRAVNKGLPTYTNVFTLVISPNYATDGIIFAGTYYGVYKSIDGGESWRVVNKGLPTYTNVFTLVISPTYATDGTIFAGTGCYPGEVFKSEDRGESWRKVLTSRDLIPLAISPTYATDGTIFAGTWGRGVFKSTNGGESWSYSGLLYVQALAISPNY